WAEARRGERVTREDAEDMHRWRYLSFDWNESKTELYLVGRFGADQGAALERAVLARAEQVVLADDPMDRGQARQADALVELATGGRDGEAAPATVVVHADARALTDEE